MVVEVTERLTSADGQILLMPEIEVDSWWSNLPCGPGICINLYHDHATSEQYHAELKSDMGIERLPSGKFSTNNLFLRLSSLAFNLLRNIGQRALAMPQYPTDGNEVSRKRLRLVIRDLIRIACKFVQHANRTFIKFGRHCPWFDIVKKLYATG